MELVEYIKAVANLLRAAQTSGNKQEFARLLRVLASVCQTEADILDAADPDAEAQS